MASHPPEGHHFSSNQINRCLPLHILMQQVHLVKDTSLGILQFGSLPKMVYTYLVPLIFKYHFGRPHGYWSNIK